MMNAVSAGAAVQLSSDQIRLEPPPVDVITVLQTAGER